MNYILILILNLIIFFCIHFLLKNYSSKLKLSDIPNYRKKHEFPVTLSGGICILLPIYIINAYLDTNPNISFIIYSSLPILFLGILDDTSNLSAKLRLAILTIISLIIFYYGINLTSLGEYYIIGNVNLGSLSIIFTIISLITLINAINFIDGIDGLAVSLFLQAIISLIIIIYINNNFILDKIIFFLIINCILFFLINTQFIKISKSFLGDSGSMSLGYILACLLIYYSQDPNNYLHPILVIWCIPILIFDFIATILIRLNMKKNPLKADRLHIHHQLLINNSSKKALLKIIAPSVILNIIGATSFYLFNSTVSLIIFVLSFTIYLTFKFMLLNRINQNNQK